MPLSLKDISDALNNGEDVVERLTRSAAGRSAGVMMNPMGVMEGLGEAVKSSYPRFKEEMNAVPGQALEDMASYEKENPLGSALGFMGNVVVGKTARGFKKAETLGRVFGGAVDELPRFEVSDEMARIKPLDQWYETALSPVGKEIKSHLGLGRALEHEKLFEQYPDMKYTKLSIDPKIRGLGQYDPVSDRITLSENVMNSKQDRMETLLHEIQHAIQEKEGFARGGSPTVGSLDDVHEILTNEKVKPIYDQDHALFERYKEIQGELLKNREAIESAPGYEKAGGSTAKLQKILDKLGIDVDLNERMEIVSRRQKLKEYSEDLSQRASFGYDQGQAEDWYKRLAGEVESRNVQNRMNWTDEMRQKTKFNDTFDVPIENQIKRMKSGTMNWEDFVKEYERLKS